MATATRTGRANRKHQGPTLVQSVCRAFDILEILARSDAGMGVAELAREMDLKTPTVHNLLQTLVARGYADQDAESLRYCLGPGAYVLGRGQSRGELITRASQDEVESLAARTGESAALGIWQGRGGEGNLVYVVNIDSRHELAARAIEGSVYSTSCGVTLLAHLPEADGSEYIRRAGPPPAPLPRGRAFEKYLASVRDDGLVTIVKPDGVTAVAAPVRDRSGGVIAAIGASGPTTRLSGAALKKVEKEVKRSAATVSQRLGYEA